MLLTIGGSRQSSIVCVRERNRLKTTDLHKKSLSYIVAMGTDRKEGCRQALAQWGEKQNGRIIPRCQDWVTCGQFSRTGNKERKGNEDKIHRVQLFKYIKSHTQRHS